MHDSYVIMTWISLGGEVVLALIMFWVGSKAAKIDQLETRLDVKADKLIDTKFESISGELKNSMNSLAAKIEMINLRLDKGEGTFDRLGDQDHKTEVRFERLVGDLKEFMRTTFASREDLKVHGDEVRGKLNQLEEESTENAKSVAVISSQCKANHGRV